MIRPSNKSTREATDLYKINDYSQTRGVNFDILSTNTPHYQTDFSNYVRYNCNFKLEWDFKPVECSNNATEGGESSFFIESTDNVSMSQVVSMHTRFKTNSKILDRFAIQSDVTKSWGDQVVDALYDVSKGIHYEVTTKLENQTRTFTFIATSIADPSKVNTRTITLTNGIDNVNGMDGLFVFRISTRNMKSEYSNFKWTDII